MNITKKNLLRNIEYQLRQCFNSLTFEQRMDIIALCENKGANRRLYLYFGNIRDVDMFISKFSYVEVMKAAYIIENQYYGNCDVIICYREFVMSLFLH